MSSTVLDNSLSITIKALPTAILTPLEEELSAFTANHHAAADFDINLMMAMNNLARAIAQWQKTNV